MTVLLDTGPLGLIASSKASPGAREANAWLQQLLRENYFVVIPEIVDYELRRKFLRGRMTKALNNLETLTMQLTFVPITTPVMRRAAEFWAFARQRGMPTAGDKALDSDMILAAQAVLIEQEWEQEAVIATTNVRHLARFATAREWRGVP